MNRIEQVIFMDFTLYALQHPSLNIHTPHTYPSGLNSHAYFWTPGQDVEKKVTSLACVDGALRARALSRAPGSYVGSCKN